MSTPPTVRPARIEDIDQLAEVHVRCWQEAYRGLVPDSVLDDPALPARRRRLWTAALTDERYRANTVAVAERESRVVGIAMSGPPLDAEAAWTRDLYVLYLRAAEHGSGAGAALLGAVLDPDDTAALWVADPNPRAAGLLPQARLRGRRDRQGRGRAAGDQDAPRRVSGGGS
ncbi:hypothetical protein P5P86_19000 [Nocardioides sp. BP30]|uniref:GNAT family N-acetyltransferase n=1 Tax=Nocardioides sp. BP30 TaxID=3036374 RepID=UPI0024698BE9|nr:hypothetical protein [Nocardioides sp. BP30]WGL52027.1 hypothetical protein P5P86_19000 [Nocardioides sp. BP30]